MACFFYDIRTNFCGDLGAEICRSELVPGQNAGRAGISRSAYFQYWHLTANALSLPPTYYSDLLYGGPAVHRVQTKLPAYHPQLPQVHTSCCCNPH